MTRRQIIRPVVDLLRAPDGERDRQLILGDQVSVSEDGGGWAHVEAAKDGYTGYLPDRYLGPVSPVTHWVSSLATHVYTESDFKSRDLYSLSFGSRVQVLTSNERFAQTTVGYIPASHLTPIGTYLNDPIAIAEMFLGTPYLWGGNSRLGIDCSGLVQTALLACGIPCPGDTGPQEVELGEALPDEIPPQRGDLLFWKGHVALVQNSDTLIHANAHHMAVALEPLQPAIQRIIEQGDGPVTSHKRLAKLSS